MKFDNSPFNIAESFARCADEIGFAETLPAYDIPDKDIIANHDKHFIWISFPDGSSISQYKGNITTMTCAEEGVLVASACANHRMAKIETELKELVDKVYSQLHPGD